MNGWRLSLLGSSASITPTGDANASFLLEGPERTVLIDAGGNIPARMRDAGADYRELTDVVITHAHLDHVYGFPFLSHCFYHGSKPIRCWTTATARRALRTTLEAFELDAEDRYLNVEFRVVDTDEPADIPLEPSLDCRTIPTDHSQAGFGLRLETNRQHLVFSGDTRPTTTLETLAQGCDVLLHDCQATRAYRRYFDHSHTDAETLGELAERVGAGILVPFHYNTEEFPIGWRDIARDIRRHFTGTLLQPRRGISFFL